MSKDLKRLQGGPLDGMWREVYGELRVPVGHHYGWTYSCDAPFALAFGVYTHRGEWVEPQRGVQVDYECSWCEENELRNLERMTDNR